MGSENGHTPAVEGDGHLDPGLSSGNEAEPAGGLGIVNIPIIGGQDLDQTSGSSEKQDRIPNDLAVLTHIAAAASGR
jgi:hypothetical protein